MDIKQNKFNFTKLDQLKGLPVNTYVDVIGVANVINNQAIVLGGVWW